MAAKKARNKIYFYVIITLIVGWIAFISVNIATTPDPGTVKLSKLAPSVQSSLKHGDSGKLSHYIDSDSSDSIADSYLKKLKRTHYDSLSVGLERKHGKQVLVRARSHGKTAACTTWDVKKSKGRYLLDPVPAAHPIPCG